MYEISIIPLMLTRFGSPGDLARIEENVSETSGRKKTAKGKKSGSSEALRSQSAEGVVYKVSCYVHLTRSQIH